MLTFYNVQFWPCVPGTLNPRWPGDSSPAASSWWATPRWQSRRWTASRQCSVTELTRTLVSVVRNVSYFTNLYRHNGSGSAKLKAKLQLRPIPLTSWLHRVLYSVLCSNVDERSPHTKFIYICKQKFYCSSWLMS